MGYDVHMTRAIEWSEHAGDHISAEEWLALIHADPELIPRPENGPYFVVWRGTNRYDETWFNWYHGHIATKNPDKATLRKMLQLAQQLGATVQGDDGEIYDTEIVESFDDSSISNEQHKRTIGYRVNRIRIAFVQKLARRRD